MDEEITQEKAREYMQVAGLVCMDLDILKEIADEPGISAADLIAQIRHTHEMKEEVIGNAEVRESRYNAASLVFSAVAAGLVRCTPLPRPE